MSMIGNILWIILGGGLIIALLYLLGGLLLCLTIVGIPFGLQCFKLAGLALSPFGRIITPGPRATDTLSVVMNVLWLITFGLSIAIAHAIFTLLLTLTLIGIPFAGQHLKLARLALTPFGYHYREL